MTTAEMEATMLFEIHSSQADDPTATLNESSLDLDSLKRHFCPEFGNMAAHMDVNDEFTYYSERMLSMQKIKRIA